MSTTTTDTLERLYRSLYRIRRVEEEIVKIYPTDRIKSPVHLSIGQEFVSVGVCEAIEPEDLAFGTYRSHAIYLAKGGDLKAMIAELYGKDTGCCRGKGGSMHLMAPEVNLMGTSAIVATTIPHAVGAAYALKRSDPARIVVSFFGDGSTEEGVYHESLNFAALKELPIIFVCENNEYAIHTHVRQRQGAVDLCERARSYGIRAERLGDGDVLNLHARMVALAREVRANRGGPVFLECMTCRWKEHVGPGDDWHLGYRSSEEAEPWKERDQVAVIGDRLPPELRRSTEQEVDREIAEAIEFAEASPFPDPGELWTDVFKES